MFVWFKIIFKIILVYMALLVATGDYIFSLWITVITYYLNVEAERRLTMRYICSQFFPGELTLLEYNILVVFYGLGCITKAKGLITKDDIQYAEQLLSEFNVVLDTMARVRIVNSFNKGKKNIYELDSVVAEFGSFFKDNARARSYFFDYQLAAAMREGELLDEELELLTVMAEQTGMSDYSFKQKIKNAEACYQFKQRFHHQHKANQQESDDFYQKQKYGFRGNYNGQQQQSASSTTKIRTEFDVLGVKEYDDYMTVKKAYRMLMREYHPDKLIAKGVSLAAINRAKERSQEVISAYGLICKSKGWK